MLDTPACVGKIFCFGTCLRYKIINYFYLLRLSYTKTGFLLECHHVQSVYCTETKSLLFLISYTHSSCHLVFSYSNSMNDVFNLILGPLNYFGKLNFLLYVLYSLHINKTILIFEYQISCIIGANRSCFTVLISHIRFINVLVPLRLKVYTRLTLSLCIHLCNTIVLG